MATIKERLKDVPSRLIILAACGIARTVEHLLPDERSGAAIEVAERLADGLAAWIEANNAWEEAYRVVDQTVEHLLADACFRDAADAGAAEDAIMAARGAEAASEAKEAIRTAMATGAAEETIRTVMAAAAAEDAIRQSLRITPSPNYSQLAGFLRENPCRRRQRDAYTPCSLCLDAASTAPVPTDAPRPGFRHPAASAPGWHLPRR